MKKKMTYLLATVCMLSMGLRAQQTAIPYAMSFEAADQAELSNWVLNRSSRGVTCTDAWVVGNALCSDGTRGLYISNDGGATSSHGNRPCVQFAFRDFVLEDGHYYVSFDWICPSANTTLYVGVLGHVGVTRQDTLMKAYDNTSVWPNVGAPKLTLTEAESWHNDGFQLDVTNTGDPAQVRQYRLYFAWVSQDVDTVGGISVGVDNVQISNANCVKPSSVRAQVLTCDSVLVSWDGSSSRYQLQYRKVGMQNWMNRSISQGNMSIMLESLDEGSYDFRVRGICYETDSVGKTDTLYSPYAYLSHFNILCPERHCVNYTALTDSTVAICTYGTTNSEGYYQTRQLAYADTGAIDFGWESINSRHTVIWDQNAYDERTNNRLKIIPQGFNASVRLGNWDYNYGAEAITYPFVVDEDHSILLLHYAIVLENPSGHDDDAMPRFVLEIKKTDGTPLDSVCGRVDLNPLNEDASWNHVSTGSSYGDDIVYKDWSLLGLNLDPYVGQTLLISVATYDCFWSAHYGYAYFALDCASAHIKNTSCGAQQNVEVEAPDGFSYLWHNDVNQTTYKTQSISIGLNDPTDWTCTLTSLENEDCSFDLYVNTEPRYPVADFTAKYEPKNCENRYVFTNSSFIRVNTNGRVKDLHEEDCDQYAWHFGFEDQETNAKNPGVVVFPEEGGTFDVRLEAMIGDGTGTCHDEKTITLNIPALGDVRQRTDTAICDGNAVLFHDEMYDIEGVYPVATQSEAGCLIVDTLFLKVVPVSTTMLGDTVVCYGETVELAGMVYDKDTTGDLVVTLQNYLGCDSVLVWHIDMAEDIVPQFAVDTLSEEREFGTIHLVGGEGWTRYEFEGVATTDTVFDMLESGTYALTFYNDHNGIVCQYDTLIELGKGCLHNMVFQRWNDVLSLKNAENNGGLTFLSYQWLKNEQPIAGANRSYYYAPEGLEEGTKYQALVTYLDADGVMQEDVTCAFYPTLKKTAEVRINPTCVTTNAPIMVSVPEAVHAEVCDMLGRKWSSQLLEEGDNQIIAPATCGMYVINLIGEEMQRSYRISVTK